MVEVRHQICRARPFWALHVSKSTGLFMKTAKTKEEVARSDRRMVMDLSRLLEGYDETLMNHFKDIVGERCLKLVDEEVWLHILKIGKALRELQWAEISDEGKGLHKPRWEIWEAIGTFFGTVETEAKLEWFWIPGLFGICDVWRKMVVDWKMAFVV